MAQENAEVKSAATDHDVIAVQDVVAEQDVAGQDAIKQGKHAPKEKAPVNKNSLKYILMAMGPGLLAAFAGNDAGGIATYSSAGATFGYSQLWTVPLMCFLLIVVQETAARMGCVTGKGIASLVRERFGIRLSTLAMGALLLSNIAVTFSEFAGIASSMELLADHTAASRRFCWQLAAFLSHTWWLACLLNQTGEKPYASPSFRSLPLNRHTFLCWLQTLVLPSVRT